MLGSAVASAAKCSASVDYEVSMRAHPQRALLCLDKDNPLRKFCGRVVYNPWFERFILFVILANCVTLGISSAREGFDETPLGQALQVVDLVYLAIFSVEAIMKITAMGLVMEKGTYLRDGWCLLDASVVLVGYISLFVPQNLTGLRAIRALRPLRTVSRVRGLKVLTHTILGSLPMLLDVFLLCAGTFLLFGIVAVQLFAGLLRFRCGEPNFSGAYNVTGPGGIVQLANVTYSVPDDMSDDMCSGPYSSDVTWFVEDGGPAAQAGPGGRGNVCADDTFCTLFGNPGDGFVSYDNILWAWLTIFQHITLSNWSDVMYGLMDALSPWTLIFYLTLIVFGAFFEVNLALAVLSTHFADDKKQDDAEAAFMVAPSLAATEANGPAQAALSSRQRADSTLDNPQPDGAPPSLGCIRRTAWAVATSKVLEYTTAALIVANTVVLCINWYGMPTSVERATNYINYAFTIYFLIELIIKLTAFGFKRYFSDGMNIFDFIVVVVSMVELIMDVLPSVSGVGPLSVLRALRLLRVFRLARSWRELNIVIRGMFRSVKASIMLVLLMFLFLLVSALLGMQIFGYKFMFCDYVEGASAVCPLGMSVWGDCPNHFNCYLPCTSADYGSWVAAPGSFYNDQAYCERFCANADAAAAADANATSPAVEAPGGCEYLAMVGKSQIPRATYDNLFWGLYSVFQLLTAEDWNSIMYNGMQTVSVWVCFYFVLVMIVGSYIIFNLFLAILLENLDFRAKELASARSSRSQQLTDDTEPPQQFGSSVRVWENPLASEEEETDADDGSDARADVRDTREGRKDQQLSSARDSKRSLGLIASSDERQKLGDGGGTEQAAEVVQAAHFEAATDAAEGAASVAPRPPYAANGARSLGAPSRLGASIRAQSLSALERMASTMQWRSRLEGKSLFLFPPESKLRLAVATVVHHKAFDATILLLILASSIALVLDGPSLDPQSQLAEALNVLDYIFLACFTIEALLKMITFGFAFTGKHAYIRDGWNILDFSIVLLGYTLVILNACGDACGVDPSNLETLRVLRALRALRPLRAASRFAGLRTVVTALFAVLPSVLNVAFVCFLFFLIFAILSVNLFKGKLYNCIDADTGDMLDPDYVLPPGATLTREWCLEGTQTVTSTAYYGAINVSMEPYNISTQWVNALGSNFDNVAVALLSLLQVASLSGWVDICFSGVDAVAAGVQPLFNHNPVMVLFFLAWILVASFFALQLFVGVTIDKYIELREESESGGVFLTPEQQLWVDTQVLLLKTEGPKLPSPPDSKWRRRIYRFVVHSAFESFISSVIVINVIFMALVHVDMTPAWQDCMTYSNLVFTCVFVVEAALKLLAFGLRGYFTDGWCCFDFVVMVLSVASVVLDMANTVQFSFLPVLRVLRVVRLVRLMRSAKGMQQLMGTLVTSLPALGNVGGLLLLFFFIFAVIGVNLFANIRHREALTARANFDTFPNALLLLARMLTLEGWNSVMIECMITTDCVLVTEDVTSPATNTTLAAGTYFDPGDYRLAGVPSSALDNQCPLSPAAAVVFFPFFLLLCGFVLINLVIAVILENFSAHAAQSQLPLYKALDSFVAAFSEFDPTGTGCIHVGDLMHVLTNTAAPLGYARLPNARASSQAALFAVDVPVYSDFTVSFVEVLHALAGRLYGTALPDTSETALVKGLGKRLPEGKDVLPYSAGHYHATAAVAAAIRACLLRRRLRQSMDDSRGAELADMAQERSSRTSGRSSRTSRPSVQQRQQVVPLHAGGEGRRMPPALTTIGSMTYVNGVRLGDLRRAVMAAELRAPVPPAAPLQPGASSMRSPRTMRSMPRTRPLSVPEEQAAGPDVAVSDANGQASGAAAEAPLRRLSSLPGQGPPSQRLQALPLPPPDRGLPTRLPPLVAGGSTIAPLDGVSLGKRPLPPLAPRPPGPAGTAASSRAAARPGHGRQPQQAPPALPDD